MLAGEVVSSCASAENPSTSTLLIRTGASGVGLACILVPQQLQ